MKRYISLYISRKNFLMWFSEVAISMSSEESDDYISDQGVCYGQVIYMFKIIY